MTLSKFQHCHDLSYSNGSFRPACPAVHIDDLTCADNIEFEVQVNNVGDVDGSEVVIVYSKPPEGTEDTHIKQVVGFQRVFVPAGESRKVSFEINVCNSLGIVDYGANRLLASGGHTIILGDDIVSFPFQVNFI